MKMLFLLRLLLSDIKTQSETFKCGKQAKTEEIFKGANTFYNMCISST